MRKNESVVRVYESVWQGICFMELGPLGPSSRWIPRGLNTTLATSRTQKMSLLGSSSYSELKSLTLEILVF